ncbi:MAG: hypothetical protein IJ021_04065 [Clostridia bacterium]|nr:hypothetical protein [Clostridia bacterium]
MKNEECRVQNEECRGTVSTFGERNRENKNGRYAVCISNANAVCRNYFIKPFMNRG